MKKFFCSIVLIFAVALICAACGSADKKDNGDAVAKSEEEKTEKEQIPQWVMDGGESASSDEEICAVGRSYTSIRFELEGMQQAIDTAQYLLCQKIAVGKEGDLPKSKLKSQYQSKIDNMGRFSIYTLVCVNRNDLEESKKIEEKNDE